jgi:glycosyltransferase involved in cell wall biosynthesis
MASRKRILWLVSWYPNKYDRYDGDFIQRHARAAALLDDVQVIFVKHIAEQVNIETEWNRIGALTEQIIYLPKHSTTLGKLRNFQQWHGIYKRAILEYFKDGYPHVMHVHIPWKAGLLALWVKKKYKLQFILTEHWGIYNDVAEDNIHTKSFLQRLLLKKIFKEAKAFVSVSKFLGEGVNKIILKKQYAVIPNVVDTELFFPNGEKQLRFTFLHVSNMVPLKNVEGLILGFHKFLLQTGTDAQLILIGNRDNSHHKFAAQLQLLDHSVFFKGEMPYEQVATEMQRSHVFVLNSNIENSPCVIGEALCCGLPVITTNVGGIPELVGRENSLLVEAGNTTSLTTAMVQIYQHYQQYNSSQIGGSAKKMFSFSSVARQIHDLY